MANFLKGYLAKDKLKHFDIWALINVKNVGKKWRELRAIYDKEGVGVEYLGCLVKYI